MTTLQAVELGVLGPLQVRQDGAAVAVPGAKPRAILTMLGLHEGSVVSADTLVELLWGEDPPRTAGKALQTHISSLRRSLGDGFVLTQGAGWILAASDVDASRYKAAARSGRDAVAVGDVSHALGKFEEALTLWRGMPELPDSRRGTSEKTRWMEGHAALVEDRADALLATGRAAEVVGDLEAAVADAPLRERRWGQLMLALYRAGRQGEALSAYRRARSLLADELGVDPGPELRRLEAAIVAQDAALETPMLQQVSAVTRAVTFLLTDIEGSTAAWEADADAMGVALARHDELVEQVVTSRGGRLIKTRGEGDATFSVFDRPSGAAAAAIELQDAIAHEPWALRQPMRIRVALHTGEVELRDGDYFGRAVNRAARLRSVAEGGQILCSGATAELVIDSLSDDVVLTDLGMRQLKNLARPEHVFELRLESADERREDVLPDEPIKRLSLPTVLVGPGPFVGRGRELAQLFSAWQTTLAGGTNAALIAGEPGVGKTRLAGEWSRQAYDQGALVIYGRCDEDLGAPYQPFAEALRSLVPCLGANRLRGLRGVEALLALVPGLTDVLPDLAAPTRADPDTERFALFDAVVALLGVASAGAPVVLILDDLHWAAKPTLLLLRHLLRFGEHARVQIVGTYRSTDLDRSHPLAAMLADLHRSAVSGAAKRIALSGLDEDDVTTYVAETGYDDEELARALASVTGGNPFFLIEALRHVDESGGHWDPSTLPQGVREAVSRRLSRLTPETNKALGAAAVVGSRFAIDLVERVVGDDLVDAFDEACKAGIVIEEHGGNYRFNHALVRQSLLAELASVRRMRLHQRIATTLETQPGADDELLAELAYHYFECAWAGNAAKAVDYCRRAADQAMARLGYEGAADLYDRALHALEEIDDELPDRNDQTAELLVARCEALLAAGDVATAAHAVAQLQDATADSARLAAWATCFDGELSMLVRPEDLDETEAALGIAADKLAELDDAAGQAKAHTVRAACLARLGRIGDCEIALDDALTAARRAGEYRRVNAVLAGAPLAALWGPNPVPRAGGRCLDVVRLLRITTDSPAVEATSTRCQAVLEAFRGRAEAARRMIDSARRTVTELGLRHALLEVEQFAGIVELVIDDSGAAESRLRQAYNGFRRMGLDADTAETAALLGRACVALDRDAEADELCTESERLAGHALKPSIAWRTLRATLLSRQGDHDGARRVAEAAVALAERTDALVDHGDACLALATVFGSAGDVGGLRAAAERAVDLYERKGAAALAEKARGILRQPEIPPAAVSSEPPAAELNNACVRALRRGEAVVAREAWDEFEQLYATDVIAESRRKMVGFAQNDLPDGWVRRSRRMWETGEVRLNSIVVIAVRGERLALTRLVLGTADASPGAPVDEILQLFGTDEKGRIALHVSFDVEDIDAALAELDAAHTRLEQQPTALRLENAASRVCQRFESYFVAGDWGAVAETLADEIAQDDRRRLVGGGSLKGRDAVMTEISVVAKGVKGRTADIIAVRGENLVLNRVRTSFRDEGPDAFGIDVLDVIEIDADERVVARIVFDSNDFDAAIAELDARYLAGEAAAHAHTWSVVADAYAAFNRREFSATTPDFVNLDHRRGAGFAPGDMMAYLQAAWDDSPDTKIYIASVHRLSHIGAVVTHASRGTSQEGGFDAEWRDSHLLTVDGDFVNRCELFDEADLDAALARFDQLSQPVTRLENAATRLYKRFQAQLSARDWEALAETVGDNSYTEDRRRVVNSGIRHDRDAIDDLRALTDVGFTLTLVDVIAIRGERLALTRVRGSGQDPGAIESEALNVVEIGADERFLAAIVFDLDDFEAAIAELDARYLAGEAAAHAHVWSMVAESYAALRRQEFPAVSADSVFVDHRRAAAFGSTDLTTYIRAGWDQHIKPYIEIVHRLSDFAAVCSYAAHGISDQGFDAEWQGVNFSTIEGDTFNHCEFFDEADLDTAIAKFDQLSQPARRLENAASRAEKRMAASFAAHDWDAATELLADEYCSDDRRHVVNVGVRHGRDVAIANMRRSVDLGITFGEFDVIATRGERLLLSRSRWSGPDQRPEAFHTEVLSIVEINAYERITARVMFDLDDFEAAIAELDARYLAGEAAAHAHTWSVIAAGYAALNRHEVPASTPDYVNIDHRLHVTFQARDLATNLRAAWDLTPNVKGYVEVVHRLSDLGAVVTHAAHGISPEGLAAEWRGTHFLMLEGGMINRCEIFDEADLDAAIARFDQLSRPIPRLANMASQVAERFLAHFAADDWDALAQTLSDSYVSDDRRQVVGSGIRRGRDAEMADLRAIADVWNRNLLSTVLATRGRNLVLTRVGVADREQSRRAFLTETLCLIEIDTNDRLARVVSFDVNDIDGAFSELDARYLAGEAAAYARTWSVIAGAYAAMNRHELPAITADSVTIDHRRATAFGSSELPELINAMWDLGQDIRPYVESVHRLSEGGAVCSYAAQGVSAQGFDAEWQGVNVVLVDGDVINHTEFFDEEDIDAALARFEQLSRPTRRLENAASQAAERLRRCFAARDWDGLADVLAEDILVDDRRRVVGTGVRRGRQANVADIRIGAEVGSEDITSTVIATRGERISLDRARFSASDQQLDALSSELLRIVEVDTDNRMTCCLMFDVDDIDAAFEQLDARYLAGEAAAHPHTWSAITKGYAAISRHELPSTTPNWVNIDHRQGRAFAPGEMIPYIHATWDVTPQSRIYIEAVHRLGNRGAVVTNAMSGGSREGFDADWREVFLLTFEGDSIGRCELFDEADLDTALARFEELNRPARRLENAASLAGERFLAYFAAGDWGAMASILADSFSNEDRRRVGNGEVRHGRDAQIADMQATAEVWSTSVTSTVMATREKNLALMRHGFSSRDDAPQNFVSDIYTVGEVDVDEMVVSLVTFDLDDFDSAITELDARYLAGEAAPYAQTWSLITEAYAAINRHAIPTTTPDFEDKDHRRGAAFAPGAMVEYLRAGWDFDQHIQFYVEAVHRLSDLGAVVTHNGNGTSRVGFDAEWREVMLYTADGDSFNRCEVFDEADLDAALERFDDLNRPALKNAASQAYERICQYLEARDWNAVAELSAENVSVDDRRRVVNAGIRTGRDAAIKDLQVAAEIGFTYKMLSVIATRGDRLALMRVRAAGSDPQAIANEVPNIVEIDSDGRIAAGVIFDLEDIDAAFEELDARYLAGEAAAHARTWSLMAQVQAAYNRREVLPTTEDFVIIDHRRGRAFAPGDSIPFIVATWDVVPDVKGRIEAVHRLTKFGAVVAEVMTGTSQEGFDAEWREIGLFGFEGDLTCRFELFDETDLDGALTRFNELQPPATQLGNAACRVWQRFQDCLAAEDWAALTEMVAADGVTDDRRRVVGAGVHRGQDVILAIMRTINDVGLENVTVAVVATRGERLVLDRVDFSGRDQAPEPFHSEILRVLEIDADERLARAVYFDSDDIDAAFEELDRRYLAGEAAAHSDTWSVIARECAAFNRHEFAAITPDPVYIDHRPLISLKGVDLSAAERAVWDLTPDITNFIAAVHRLSQLGAVVTQVVKGTSPEGFDAEWQMFSIITVEGDLISHYEVFDEADLDAALARFDELRSQTRQLENAASQAVERFWSHFAARDWDALAETMADDVCTHDRRRVVNADVLHRRSAHVANMRAVADVGFDGLTSTVTATRGHRLVLIRIRSSVRDSPPGEVTAEMLSVIGVDADHRIVAAVMFDADQIDAAFEELDARYVAGEAAAHARTWSLMAGTHAALSRHEIPATTPDWVNIDHRPGVAFAPGDLVPYTRDTFNDVPDASFHIVAVHRLSDLGAVITQAIQGTSREGLDAEWQNVGLFTFEGELANRCEIFAESDLDAAIARFDELQPQTRRLENAASQAFQRLRTHAAARDWAAVAEVLADDISTDDRRSVVNAGIRQGRDAEIANMKAVREIGTTNTTSWPPATVIATRGNRLALCRAEILGPDQAFNIEMLLVTEVDTDDRIAAHTVFDPDDMDAAFEELDARYLAGEAAAYADTWSVVSDPSGRFNRHELPLTTPDPAYIDHRPLVSIEGGDLAASIRAVWDITSTSSAYIESVHRLSERGAVFTEVLKMTSQEGFDAELWMIVMFTVEGDLISGVEVFEEADLDVALARFEELHPQTPRPENAATRIWARVVDAFNRRHLEDFLALSAANLRYEDRRKGLRDEFDGLSALRNAVLAMFEVIPSSVQMTAEPIAIRGSRLSLNHVCFRDTEYDDRPITVELLQIVGVSESGLLHFTVSFDPDDIDAAFEELDARYLAGEAAAYSQTWSVIAQIHAAFNRHELPAIDWIVVDHRRGTLLSSSNMTAAIRAFWDLTPAVNMQIEVVHRLNSFGAVATHTLRGTSPEGFEAEWRMIYLVIVEDDGIDRVEMFDETDLDAALARFEELQPPARLLENAASRAHARLTACVAATDRNGLSEILADDIAIDDRRRVVNSGITHGRDAAVANMGSVIDVGLTDISSTVTATRGDRLDLCRTCVSGEDRPEAFQVEFLSVVEIEADERIVARVLFDPEDIDAAFEELDARYLAGEAAAHAHTWSVITQAYAALNRRELPPAKPDWVNIDHRRGIAFAPGDMAAYIRVGMDLAPDTRIYIETVHRLNSLGAVITQVLTGTSQDGFDAEWREIGMLTFEGELISRSEVFDEADLDAALATFDELARPAPLLDNAATQLWAQVADAYNRRDLEGFLALSAADLRYEDRRKGLRDEFDGSSAQRKAVLAMFEASPSGVHMTAEPVAIRGSRLSLNHVCYRDTAYDDRPITVEMMQVVEVSEDGLLHHSVSFDPDDIDAAFAELDARYMAGEAAPYARTWSAMARTCAVFNQGELPATKPDSVFVDHRPVLTVDAVDLPSYLRAMWDVTPDIRVEIEAVHRLSELGAVLTHAVNETSPEGFKAEWRGILIYTLEADMVNRCEVFDEADLDAALARFDELDRPAS